MCGHRTTSQKNFEGHYWAKGKPAWLPFPVFGAQISRDMVLYPYMRAGLPLSIRLEKSEKVSGQS